MVFETTAQILRELTFTFREGLQRLQVNASGYEFNEKLAQAIERFLFASLSEPPFTQMTITGVVNPRRDLLCEFFKGLGVDEGTAGRYADSLMESRAQFDDQGERLRMDPSWTDTTHWRARLNRWQPLIFANARRTYQVIDEIYQDAAENYRGTADRPEAGIPQIVDLLERFPDLADRVYRIAGFATIQGFPPTRNGRRATIYGADPESQFEKDVNDQLDAQWWTRMLATAGLVVLSIVATVVSAGTLGPVVATAVGAGLGTVNGGLLVLERSGAVQEARVAVRVGAMSEERLAQLERELDGAWGALAVDVATGGILGRVGGASVLAQTLRGAAVTGAGGGLATAMDPNVWDSEDRVGLIMIGVVIGTAGGAIGTAAGAGASELIQRNLRVQLAASRVNGPIRPGTPVRLSVGRNQEPVDATVISLNRYSHTIRVNVRGRQYDVQVERTVDLRNAARRPSRTAEPNWGGRNFEITPIAPSRAPRVPPGQLTQSARDALARPNELLMRAYSGAADGPTTNLSGRSWWARVPIEEARAIMTGFETGHIGPGVEHAINRYGFRPSADPNTTEIWMVDLHSLASRNPGANFQIDQLGDTVVTTPNPQTLLNSVRRYRLSRRTPVESYWDLVR